MHIDYKRHRKSIKAIDLLPLINVVFLLILFVLIAGKPTTRHPQNIQIAETTQITDYGRDKFVIHLRADNRFYLPDGLAYSATDIAAKLLESATPPTEIMPELIGDHAASASALLDLRQALNDIGITTLALKTQTIKRR